MWPRFDGKPYNRMQLAARIAGLNFSHWKRKDGTPGRPQFITLHNTSEPDYEMWLSWSVDKRQSYIRNVRDWYEGKGWRAGPHFFVTPTADPVAFGFSDPETAGTHCSCFNSDSIGIEMVGEFAREPFNSGPGAIVRDNAVYLMALLHLKIGLSADTMRFHVECRSDNHDCPGKNVHKPDVIALVKAQMAELSGVAPAPVPAPVPVPPAQPDVIFEVTGKMSTFGGPRDNGMSATEGLALYETAEAMAAEGLGDWLLTPTQANASGLGRRLRPEKPYVACRWDYHTIGKATLRHAQVEVTNQKTGKALMARAVDWGPNEHTGRAADLSPGLAGTLGLETGDVCRVRIYKS